MSGGKFKINERKNINFRLLTNLDNSNLQGEDRQKSKASAPYMARLEPSGTLIFTKGIRRLYDLPVFTAASTLSITSLIYSLFLI
ncbi:hypothetical protein YEP4_18824 [Yersinia enterocolitica subsp. palearctica YE-P4]|uniref:Uncharacterized protein n=1 Tax=Yersinia enterocolitica W22703 TaxID=913028 RepID=F4MV01_YEREN|nr:hypothetical protein XM56_16770 [Yersinia enterocolitica]EHB22643.1 hypothetical protein IOK_01399 [Yersinia enterocolitica subsp. palearctica PhRBD_Ye1]EOR65115.1 hypothetical protein YE150_18868 [Yersinia enterocolitica subsp. palearctica YE-150]EOR65512.1 hypothetical protein YEP4_18824 [Yersinia enterocolitica subsp. palearctica YE-P4]EOR66064.1 hypothetical protein YE149_18922 [Yersinia enterocolitica subsp. palearctica YE-149]EOR73497.1 hypothetical protein YEP1_18914 [Yersinia entero